MKTQCFANVWKAALTPLRPCDDRLILKFLNVIDHSQFSPMNTSFVYTITLFQEIVVSNILYHTEEGMCYINQRSEMIY